MGIIERLPDYHEFLKVIFEYSKEKIPLYLTCVENAISLQEACFEQIKIELKKHLNINVYFGISKPIPRDNL